ncbi:MAG: hypothetical protein ABWZ25_17250 [Chitinophagaceae bacterium]
MVEFGEFLITNIENNDISGKCFYFINEAIENGGYKTEDVIVIGVFHRLYDDPGYIQKARLVLSTKALAVFDKGDGLRINV